MRVIEREVILSRWHVYHSKLDSFSSVTKKMYFAKYIRGNYLYFSSAEKKEDLENNFEKIKFYGKELPPIHPGTNDQSTETPEDIDIPQMELEHELEIKKYDTITLQKDEYGNEQLQKLSMYELYVEFYKENTNLIYFNTGYDVNQLLKEVEKIHDLLRELKLVNVDSKVPIVVEDPFFYTGTSLSDESLITAFYGDVVEEGLSWVTDVENFRIKIEEDPKMFKPLILFDHDGLRTKRKVVAYQDKIHPLYDVYNAFKYNKNPTGNGFYLDTASPTGIGYTYVSVEAENTIKLEELDKVVWGMYFKGWHTCNWNEGRISVKLDNGILYENGTPIGIVNSGSLEINLPEYVQKAISVDKEVSRMGIKYKPFVIF